MMIKKSHIIIMLTSFLFFSQPSFAFFGSMFEPMTEMIKQSGSVANNIIDTGESSFSEMVQLTSKLSDDIGQMANRILEMADKIGEMADRIVKTEEILAQLLENMTAGGQNGLNSDDLIERLDRIEQLAEGEFASVLSIEETLAFSGFGPELSISNNPKSYMLYISYNGLFSEGKTMVTRVDVDESGSYNSAWENSVNTLTESNTTDTLSIAVKAISESGAVSPLSNSVQITLQYN